MALKQPLKTRQACKYFRIGREGAHWYDKTYATITEVFGVDTGRLFCDFLAATSPNSSVKGNVTLALKALEQWRDGREFRGFMGVVETMLRKVVKGEQFGGRKVQKFADALKGDLNAVVVDRWMLRAYGIEKDIVTNARYREIEAHIKQVAKREKLYPAQVQAAIWCGIKLDSDRKKSNDTRKIEDFLPLSFN